jgi:RTX calcium-binding nonapeptide repeat (4 copies)
MSGTTFTWIGGIGNTDFLWTTASNWLVSGGVQAAPPNSPTAVVIVDSEPVDTDIINGASITVGSLSIGGIGPSAGQLLVAGSKTVVGDIFTGGGGTLESVGPIVVTSTDVNGGLVGGPGGIVKAPSMTVGVGAAIGGGGTYDVTTIVNNGLILADGGRSDLALGPVVLKGATISGTGSLEVAGPSTLELDAATAQNIVVDPGSTATIKLDSPTSFKGGIALGAGAHLNLFLSGQAPTGATISAGTQTLTITGATGTIETIPFVSDGSVTVTTPTSAIAGFGEVSLLAAAPPVQTPPVQTPPVQTPPVQTPPVQTPPVQTPPPQDPATILGAFDTTTSKAVVAVGEAYTGPVAGLEHQYINITSDGLNIAASSPNWFIHSGSGEDAIAASSGANVLDGGTGSNFLTGGSGTDTFFVDNRGATADIWSTVVNFHAGDSATVWGVTPQDFALNFVDGQGAGGFTGLTLHATAAGKPTASLTLAGFSQADLNSGRLSVQFGTDQASGSAFMFMHANS